MMRTKLLPPSPTTGSAPRPDPPDHSKGRLDESLGGLFSLKGTPDMPTKKRFAVRDENEEETPSKRRVIATSAPVAVKKAKRGVVDSREALRDRLRKALAPALEKQGGHLGAASEMEDLHKPQGYTKTGIHSLDIALSGRHGGIPHGRFIEVYGPESSGKSATAEFIMSAFHRQGGIVHHIDAEMTRDDERIRDCYGLTTQDFEDVDAPDLESVWDYAYGVVKALGKEEKNTPPNLLILDSLAACPARVELTEKAHDDAHVAAQSRANSKGVRKTVRLFAASSCVFLFINQIRDKIGAMGYGPKTDTPGGRALKFAYSIRLQVARIGSIKSGEDVIGQTVRITTQKNKHAPPKMECDLVLSYKTGIDIDASNLLWFQTNGVLKHQGKVWKFNGQDIGGKANFGKWCKEHPDEVAAAVDALREEILSKTSSDDAEAEDGDA